MPGVVETTDTFTTNQVITSTLMNDIIDQTLFTSDAIVFGNSTLALVAGKLKVGTITSNEMGANAVTLNAIADGTITNAKVNASAAIALSKLATGALPTAITIASANIVDGTIVTADIADAAITAPKLDGAQTGSAPIYGTRAWVVFDLLRNAAGGADTANTDRFIINSGNVSSVTKTGTGAFTVNFTVGMPNANYAYYGSGMDTDSAGDVFIGRPNAGIKTTGSIQLKSLGFSSARDFAELSVAFLG
jgi:hypothetical protein